MRHKADTGSVTELSRLFDQIKGRIMAAEAKIESMGNQTNKNAEKICQ